MNIDIRSSWEVEFGWAWPLGQPPPNVPERIEAAPSLRGTPPPIRQKAFNAHNSRFR